VGAAEPQPKLLLSFDVEDLDQIVRRSLGEADWARSGPALERQMATIFDLLDELQAHATFFVLGMTGERYPDVVREIAARGHEVACHGQAHERVFNQDPDEFRRDVERCMGLIEELTGRLPVGYRAPAFSINRSSTWAYEVLADLGFRYDSSQYDSPRIPRRLGAVPPTPYRLRLPSGRELWELPVAVWHSRGRSVPVGGGTYWRLLPAAVLRAALRRVASEAGHPMLYFHPYECDPERLRLLIPSKLASGALPRALAWWLWMTPGRRRIVPRIRAMKQSFRFASYEEAHADIHQSHRASTRALSADGVLV
jgi:polysaccharide deacetylase family protein (PEP-CTERM system associated)